MKLKISFMFFLFASIGFSQEFIVESVDFTDPFYDASITEFPRLKSLSNENSEVVEKINAEILSGLNLDSYDEEDMYSQEDRDERNMFKWSELEYDSEIKDDILYLTYNFFYLTSYSMYQEETFYFDLKTGEKLPNWDIPFHTLFTLSGYLDFINKYWLDSVKSKFAEAIECADEEEPSCGFYDIDSYHVDSNKLSLSLTYDCFPHYAQACTPYLTVSIELDSVKQYLSDIGRYMLLESNYFTKTPIDKFLENNTLSQNFKNNKFIFAKIDNKYPVSIAINIDEKNQVSGYYYYDKNRVNLILKGQLKNNVLSLTETDKNKVTGLFEFIINAEHGYIESGTWSNPTKTKTYDIEITEVREAVK